MLPVPIKITIYSVMYFTILIYLSPILDHIFSDLDTDIEKGVSKAKITLDIVAHLLVIVLFLYIVNYIINNTIKKYIPVGPNTNESIGIVCGVTLVGLQRNLIDKLKYITGEYKPAQ